MQMPVRVGFRFCSGAAAELCTGQRVLPRMGPRHSDKYHPETAEECQTAGALGQDTCRSVSHCAPLPVCHCNDVGKEYEMLVCKHQQCVWTVAASWLVYTGVYQLVSATMCTDGLSRQLIHILLCAVRHNVDNMAHMIVKIV